MPHAVANDSAGTMFTLNLKASLKNPVELGIGSYLTTSTNSMLFLSGAYRTMSFSSLDMSVNGWLGQNYIAASGRAGISLTQEHAHESGRDRGRLPTEILSARPPYIPEQPVDNGHPG